MKKFLEEIEAYLSATGMVAGAFGPKIGRTRTFVHDLRKGHSPSLDTAEKARKFMADNPPSKEASQKTAA